MNASLFVQLEAYLSARELLKRIPRRPSEERRRGVRASAFFMFAPSTAALQPSKAFLIASLWERERGLDWGGVLVQEKELSNHRAAVSIRRYYSRRWLKHRRSLK